MILKDARSSEDGKHIIVDEHQNCITVTKNKKIGIGFERKFDTCDEADLKFHGGTIQIFWMRGSETFPEGIEFFPAPEVKDDDFGFKPLQLLAPDKMFIPEE